MFRAFKYIFFVNVYRQSKKNIAFVLGSLLALMLTVMISNDLITATAGLEKYLLILMKWSIVFLILGLLVINLKSIWKKAIKSVSLAKEKDDTTEPNIQKESILTKSKLKSRSDLILEKYKDK